MTGAQRKSEKEKAGGDSMQNRMAAALSSSGGIRHCLLTAIQPPRAPFKVAMHICAAISAFSPRRLRKEQRFATLES